MNFNIRNGAKLKFTIPAGGVGDNFLVVDPTTGGVSFRTPSEVGALAIGGSSGDVLYNNAGVIGGFGDWNGTRLEIGGNFKLGEVAQAGSARTIIADGSASDVAITLNPKGAGALNAGTSAINVGNTGDVLIDNVSASANSATTLRSKGTGSTIVKSPSGNVVLSAGASSEVVLGESTTAASTRIISAEGSGANVDIIIEPKGSGTLISEANFTIGSISLSGSSRTIKSEGSAANVDLILASKGDGNISLISESPDYGSGENVTFIPNTATPTTVVPVGGGTLYSSSQNLIWFGTKSFNLTNQFVGKNINSVVAAPTITEDGQGLVWDNTAGEYTLGTLTASAGGVNTNIQYNNSGNLGGFGSWDGSTMTVPGSFQIGDSGTAGTNRNITAEGSVGNVSITLDPKGTANIILAVDGGQVNIGSGSGSSRTIQAVGSSTDVNLVLSAQGAGSIYTGSDFYIGNTSLAGSDRILAPEGSATDVNLQIVPKGDGNISLFSTTPVYGGGEGVVYIKQASTAPTGSITGGGAVYVTSSAIRFVNSSGTDYDLTQTAQVAVRKNSTGGDIGIRRRINFIEGTNITLTIADDGVDDEIDVTIEATAGGGGYTDEEAQDAVGSILVDTSSINFTYDDTTPQIYADVISDSNVQRVAIRKNSTGGDTGTRRRLNFIESGPISLTLGDDGLDNELDITIGSSATTLSGYGITDAWRTTGSTTITTPTLVGNPFFEGSVLVGPTGSTITASTTFDSISTTSNSTTNAGRFRNSTGTTLMLLRGDGYIQIGGGANAPSVYPSANGSSISSTGAQLVISGQGAFTIGTQKINFSSQTAQTGTTGDLIFLGTTSASLNFAPTSGSADLTYFRTTPTINTTGTYSGGDIVGFEWNPVLTSTTGIATHVAFKAVTGALLIGGLTLTSGSVIADFQSTTQGIVIPRVTNIASVTSPVDGMVVYDSTTDLWNFRQNGAWVTIAGTGDVVGPASATDNALALFNTTTGKLIKNSDITYSSGSLLRAGTLSVQGSSGANTFGNALQFNNIVGHVRINSTPTGTTPQQTDISAQGPSANSIDANDVFIFGGSVVGFDGNAGDVYIYGGTTNSSGQNGNVAINSTSALSTANWQGMELGMFVANATTAPTGNPVNGVFLYAEDLSASSKLKIRDEAGNVGFVPIVLYGSATLNFGSIAAGAKEDLTITVTGAAVGDPVTIGIPNAAVDATAMFMAWVSAADTVTVRCMNFDQISAIDPASATFKASVIKQ